MARRISGSAVVIMAFDDALDKYAGRIIDVEKKRASYRFEISSPGVLVTPVDSPEAYDNVAKAALAFAEAEGAGFDVDYDESGIRVFRSRMSQDRWYEGKRREAAKHDSA